MGDQAAAQHAEARSSGVVPLSPEELAAITSRAPLTAETVERLNKALTTDPDLGFRVVKSLVHDPTNWDHLFTLDDAHRADLRAVRERSRSGPDTWEDIVDKAKVHSDGYQVTLQIMGLHSGEPVEEAESTNPWFVPDHLTMTVSESSAAGPMGTTTTTTATVAVVWDF